VNAELADVAEHIVAGAGAGVSGLFMAETLKRARIDFTVYEKAGEVGGTWRDNTPFPASLSMSYRANMNFRSSPTITGRANMPRPPRSVPT
jgi:cation diffusion facilitator CzcD-associated flavoprotein CzcO